MVRRPTQPNYSTPPSQGNVVGGGGAGLAGDSAWEIGRLRADIDNLKIRVSELESDAKEVRRFHHYIKAIATAAGILLGVLGYFLSDDIKTIKSLAEADQVHRRDEERNKTLQNSAVPTQGAATSLSH